MKKTLMLALTMVLPIFLFGCKGGQTSGIDMTRPQEVSSRFAIQNKSIDKTGNFDYYVLQDKDTGKQYLIVKDEVSGSITMTGITGD